MGFLIAIWQKNDCLHSTCGDAVKGLRHQVVDLIVQLWGRTFAVDLIHSGIGAIYPLHQPLELTVTGELVPPQVSAETKTHKTNLHTLNSQQDLLSGLRMQLIL